MDDEVFLFSAGKPPRCCSPVTGIDPDALSYDNRQLESRDALEERPRRIPSKNNASLLSPFLLSHVLVFSLLLDYPHSVVQMYSSV